MRASTASGRAAATGNKSLTGGSGGALASLHFYFGLTSVVATSRQPHVKCNVAIGRATGDADADILDLM
jgi:hypothetical protein